MSPLDEPTQDMVGRRRSVDPQRPEEVPSDGDLDVGDPPNGVMGDEPVEEERERSRQDGPG